MLTWVLDKIIGSQNERVVKHLTPLAARINELEPEVKNLSDGGLKEKADQLRQRLKSRIEQLGGGLLPDGSVPLGEIDPADEDALKQERKRRLKIENQAMEELLPEAFALVRRGPIGPQSHPAAFRAYRDFRHSPAAVRGRTGQRGRAAFPGDR